MKFSTLAALVAATVGLAAAQPQAHSLRHVQLHKRDPNNVKTVHSTVYILNGQEISAQEVAEGVKNGTLTIINGAPVEAPAPAAAPAPAPKHHKHKHHHQHHQGHEHKHQHHSKLEVKPVKIQTSVDEFNSNNKKGVNTPFPDGQLDCSTFPSEYGAVPVDWEGLGGWSGIQSPGVVGAAIDDIMTVVSGQCHGTNCCSEGDYCSYACPAGYQKSQWPEIQGATGQSVGGLLCKGGKLHLTNPSLSKTICMKGTNKVKVKVQNTMAKGAAVCRTDYPGTESETVPLNAAPGSISPLTCPDADNYFKWTGASTSAQYYVNPAGIPVSTACRWGQAGDNWGNFAPLNLGVGYSNNAAWLSIFQNSPTTNAKLDYTIELVGDNGGFDNMVGRCKYVNGQFCSGDDYSDCSDQGCTVSVASGTATYVFS